MKIEFRDSFIIKLNRQINYIATDKPQAARKFRKDLLLRIQGLTEHPFQYRKSIYSESDQVRDLVFKGYTVVYKVDEQKNLISIFALVKNEI
tara:strand:- start:78 stop:353 length:276 start_codon:yes stop_codon:yes gene_type:complete